MSSLDKDKLISFLSNKSNSALDNAPRGLLDNDYSNCYLQGCVFTMNTLVDLIKEGEFDLSIDKVVEESLDSEEVELTASQELKKLIAENPDLPIKFFTREDVILGSNIWIDNYSTSELPISKVSIVELTTYKNQYFNEENLLDELYNDFYEDYSTDEEVEEAIRVMIKGYKFEKVIHVLIDN